jgi:K+-sensing histidine kinase KdpD
MQMTQGPDIRAFGRSLIGTGIGREAFVGFLFVAIATLVRSTLTPYLNFEYATIFFILAVVASSYVNGPRGAVVTTLLSLVALLVLFVEPHLAIAPVRTTDLIGLAMFLAGGFAIAAISGRMNLAQRRARAKHEAEAAELKQQLRLGERMAQVGALAAGITHDIANVMLPLRAQLQMIERRRAEDSDGLERDLERVRVFAEYLTNLARGLNDLVADPMTASAQSRTNLAEWRAAVEPILRTTLPRHIALSLAIPDDLPAVALSQHALGQAVFNLVLNARKAMPDNEGGSVSVAASYDADRATVTLQVVDTGPGISDAALEAFARAEPQPHPERGVAGMGLTLVRTIIEGAGGRVTISRRAVRGTVVLLELPTATGNSSKNAA